MPTYEIRPLEGVGPIKLGATKDQVHHVLGAPKSCQGNTEYFCGSSLQVTYDASGHVEFIELASDLAVVWNGLNLFTTPAADVVAAISQFSPLASNEAEPGYTFTFPEAEVGFWRPIKPDENDPEEGKYFESVGLGNKGYYSECI